MCECLEERLPERDLVLVALVAPNMLGEVVGRRSDDAASKAKYSAPRSQVRRILKRQGFPPAHRSFSLRGERNGLSLFRARVKRVGSVDKRRPLTYDKLSFDALSDETQTRC